MKTIASAAAIADYRTRVLAQLAASPEPMTRPELVHALSMALPQSERDRGRVCNEAAAYRALGELLAEGRVERRTVERLYAQYGVQCKLKRDATGYALIATQAPKRSKRK